MALLDQLSKLDERLGVEDHHNRTHSDKLGYIDTQVEEMRAVLWRLRTDIILNNNIKASGEVEQEQKDAKVKEMERDIKQMVQAVNVLLDLRRELGNSQ